jgi:hypothetical protein
MDGTGVYTLLSGSKYEGGFKNCKRDGQGQFTYAVYGKQPDALGGNSVNANDKIIGGFRGDKRHGACTYTFFNGETFECTFVDGHCDAFDARQAAVRAAPDAAAVRARAEADAAVKAERKAAAIRYYLMLGIAVAAAAAAFIRFKRR